MCSGCDDRKQRVYFRNIVDYQNESRARWYTSMISFWWISTVNLNRFKKNQHYWLSLWLKNPSRRVIEGINVTVIKLYDTPIKTTLCHPLSPYSFRKPLLTVETYCKPTVINLAPPALPTTLSSHKWKKRAHDWCLLIAYTHSAPGWRAHEKRKKISKISTV